jgi:hypothetical protein
VSGVNPDGTSGTGLAMIDPKDFDLRVEEMSLASKTPTPVSPSWRDLWTYEKETHPAFPYCLRLPGRLVLLRRWLSQSPDILTLDGWNKN